MRLSHFYEEIKGLKEAIVTRFFADLSIQEMMHRCTVEEKALYLLMISSQEYFLNIIADKAFNEECSTIGHFLENLRTKVFLIEDLFLLCTHIQKSISEEIFSNSFILESLKKDTDVVNTLKCFFDEFNTIFNTYFTVALKKYYEVFLATASQYSKAIDVGNIVSKTDDKGVMIFVNDEFCRISGYKREELLGKSHNIVRHPNMPQSAFKEMWSTIKEGKVWQGTVENRAKNGESYFVTTTVLPILDSNQEVSEYISIRNDITEEIKHQNEIKKHLNVINRQNQDLIFQNRAVAMGEMIGNIAHQWRQPLQVIGMTLIDAQLDLDEFESIDDIRGKEFVSAIEFQVEYLTKTIDDFRNFFDPKKEKVAFCLDEIIQYTVALVHQKMERENIKILIQHTQNDGYIEDHKSLWRTKLYGYPSELSQVFLNLISNAKDALIENKIDNPVIHISCILNGEYVSVQISDNGGGIPEKILVKVFDPYFTTKHQKQGTGIGLYMSRIIVEEHHNGLLSVANNEQGAVFTINLPINKESL
ncbi:MAG: PAS domain-containing sensor histidine kinase [Campylobacterales bacterium]|nr:PAS domain-containing sensor histidine kinase [Campylobacterales bacterium]